MIIRMAQYSARTTVISVYAVDAIMSASLIGHESQAPLPFVFGPFSLVAVWVTLLYAVVLRRCGAASISRSGMESHAFGRALQEAPETI